MGLWKDFALWTLIIGPILVTIYILLSVPLQFLPIGDNFPQEESVFLYFLPLALRVVVPGAILGSFLFLAKEVVGS